MRYSSAENKSFFNINFLEADNKHSSLNFFWALEVGMSLLVLNWSMQNMIVPMSSFVKFKLIAFIHALLSLDLTKSLSGSISHNDEKAMLENVNKEIFGRSNMLEVIEEKREKKGITQKELTSKLNIAVKTYNNWIQERNPIPSNKLIEMSKILGLSIDEMLGVNTKN